MGLFRAGTVHDVGGAREADRPRLSPDLAALIASSNLLNNHLPLAREMQLHMRVHFGRRMAELADGTVTYVSGAIKTPFS